MHESLAVCVCARACVRAHACMCVFMLLCVYDVSSHWYLAIICFPYLVGEQQTTSPSDLATAAAKPKQVVTVHCTKLPCFCHNEAPVDVCGPGPLVDA